MKNRRGEGTTFLAEKVVKILIAIICLVFLAWLVGTIWYNSTKDSDLSKAQSSLMLISEEILRLEGIGLENPNGIQISSPSGWEIISFVETEKPNKCIGEKCVCICDIAWNDNVKSQAEKCDDNGVCYNVENLLFFERITISSNGNLFVSIKKTENGIEIGEIK
jgi:type II secretory pathway pseudopilin PulG